MKTEYKQGTHDYAGFVDDECQKACHEFAGENEELVGGRTGGDLYREFGELAEPRPGKPSDLPEAGTEKEIRKAARELTEARLKAAKFKPL